MLHNEEGDLIILFLIKTNQLNFVFNCLFVFASISSKILTVGHNKLN